MLSKGSVAVLPVLLLGIIWWLRPLTRRDLLRIAPFFLVAVVLAAVNMWFQTHGTEVVIRTASFAERLLGAGGVVWFYLYKALLPFDLAFIYPQWHIETGNPLWWLPLLAAWPLRRCCGGIEKAGAGRFYLPGDFSAWRLVPVMGFTDVGFMKYSLVADHYQHIAIIGVIALASAGWSAWHQQCAEQSALGGDCRRRRGGGTLAFLTWRQNGIYRDAITLYQATLEKNPELLDCPQQPGHTHCVKQAGPGGIEHYRQALRLKPDYPEAHNNLGIALVQTGRLAGGDRTLPAGPAAEARLPRGPQQPGQSHCPNRSTQEAIEHYQQALRLKP